jgi:hypothetical protein
MYFLCYAVRRNEFFRTVSLLSLRGDSWCHSHSSPPATSSATPGCSAATTRRCIAPCAGVSLLLLLLLPWRVPPTVIFSFSLASTGSRAVCRLYLHATLLRRSDFDGISFGLAGTAVPLALARLPLLSWLVLLLLILLLFLPLCLLVRLLLRLGLVVLLFLRRLLLLLLLRLLLWLLLRRWRR